MATFTLNTIQFTADNSTLKRDGQRHSKFGVVENEDFSDEVLQYNNGVIPFVNGVEIDWNNAYLPNNKVNINTTGELLHLIDNLKPHDDGKEIQLWEDFDEELNNIVQKESIQQDKVIDQEITQSMTDENQEQQKIEEPVEEEPVEVLPPETTQTTIYV